MYIFCDEMHSGITLGMPRGRDVLFGWWPALACRDNKPGFTHLTDARKSIISAGTIIPL